MSSSNSLSPVRRPVRPVRPVRPITKCDRCRSRKSKCDSAQPCEPCRKSKADCLYTHGRPTQLTGKVVVQEKAAPPSPIPPARRSYSSPTIGTISVRKERNDLITKINTLQRLLNDVTAHQTLQAYQMDLSLQTQSPPIHRSFGIDLETNNLATHFSKLWLRKDPDQSFFQATHPALVKLRQEQVPRWQESRRWKTWLDYQTESKYQQLKGFEAHLLPGEEECGDLMWRFIVSCDWYFEVLTEKEAKSAKQEIYHYRSLGIEPTTPEQWTRIALCLAVCRLTKACLDWASTDENEDLSRKRCNQILNWCDLAVMALRRAELDQNPTVEAMRVLIILTSTIFFETDYGLMGSSPQMIKLHVKAVEVAERLNLHRDPPAHLPSKEKDDRRRMWWALVTIDSHFCSTGATSKGVLRIQDSDTKLPVARESHTNASYDYTDESSAPIDLRSARSRFELGKFNNRCCQLLAQRRPLATLTDIWKLDQDLVQLEKRVLQDQRWSSNLDINSIFQRPIRPSVSIDDTLRNGQQIFYIGFWHIRSKIHRGLLYTKLTTSDAISQINVDSHRDIVRRCSICLLHLYRHTKLPTAFISAIASAALTLCLELIDQPLQPYHLEIRTLILEVFSRLQANFSPIIIRACQVLEYFLEPIRPHAGIPRVVPTTTGLSEWEGIEYPFVNLPDNSQEFSINGSLITGFPVMAPQGNPIRDDSLRMLNGRVEHEGSQDPYLEYTNEQPMIGLTNPISQVTPDDLLQLASDERNVFPQNLGDAGIETTQESRLGDESYFTNEVTQGVSTNLETRTFPTIDPVESYLQSLLTSPQLVGNHDAQLGTTSTTTSSNHHLLIPSPNPTVYSNNQDNQGETGVYHASTSTSIQPTSIFSQPIINDENMFSGQIPPLYETDFFHHFSNTSDHTLQGKQVYNTQI